MIEGCNASRELARFFSEAKEEHWKALYRFVGYLKDNQSETRLIYRKPRELRMIGNVESDYATNKAGRRNISGCLMTLGGGKVTNWFSQTQRSTLCQALRLSIVHWQQELRMICSFYSIGGDYWAKVTINFAGR